MEENRILHIREPSHGHVMTLSSTTTDFSRPLISSWADITIGHVCGYNQNENINLTEHQAVIAEAIAKGVDYDTLNQRFFGTSCVLRKLKDIKLFQNLLTEGMFDLASDNPVNTCANFIRWGFVPSDWNYYAATYELARAVQIFTQIAHRIDPAARVHSISGENFITAAIFCGIRVETTPSGCNTKFRMQPVNRAALRIATGNILEDY